MKRAPSKVYEKVLDDISSMRAEVLSAIPAGKQRQDVLLNLLDMATAETYLRWVQSAMTKELKRSA